MSHVVESSTHDRPLSLTVRYLKEPAYDLNAAMS